MGKLRLLLMISHEQAIKNTRNGAFCVRIPSWRTKCRSIINRRDTISKEHTASGTLLWSAEEDEHYSSFIFPQLARTPPSHSSSRPILLCLSILQSTASRAHTARLDNVGRSTLRCWRSSSAPNYYHTNIAKEEEFSILAGCLISSSSPFTSKQIFSCQNSCCPIDAS